MDSVAVKTVIQLLREQQKKKIRDLILNPFSFPVCVRV